MFSTVRFGVIILLAYFAGLSGLLELLLGGVGWFSLAVSGLVFF